MNITPAANLQGQTINNGWIVKKKIDLGASTGGYFSISYEVENQKGKVAFLKALDFSKAQQSNDPLKQLQFMIDAFVFERDLLYKCREKRMRKIVTPIDDGNISIDGFIPPYNTVYYLIFEMAEGDIRNQMKVMNSFDLAWALRTLHGAAVGMQQLHLNDIVHQDLKPSNVLIYKNEGSKIGDLGNACDKTVPSPPIATVVPLL